MKICSKCLIEKPNTEFYKGKQASCKECDKIRSNKWTNSNKERKKITNKAWYAKNTERVHEIGLNKYGITIEIYQKMLIEQNGTCKICNQHESKFKKKLCVDHCHQTGQVRALLCSACNQMIGLAKENVETLQAAILFLEQFKK
jgi:hypothetical protein